MNYEEYTVKVFTNGKKHWFQNGKLHRTDGPAVELADGYKSWHQNGKLHRTDGPAIEYSDGDKEYWIEGKPLTEKQFLARTAPPSCDGKIVEIEGKKYKLTEL